MRYDWVEDKRHSNIAKHGLDFADVARGFDWDTALFAEDDTRHEARDQALGYLFHQLVVVVCTLRGDTCRLISLRRADRRERKAYEQF